MKRTFKIECDECGFVSNPLFLDRMVKTEVDLAGWASVCEQFLEANGDPFACFYFQAAVMQLKGRQREASRPR